MVLLEIWFSLQPVQYLNGKEIVMSSDYATIIDINKKSDHPDEMSLKAEKKPVRCFCPKCGITHILNIFWTGTTTPRKYCHKCREAISSVDDQYIYEIVPDKFHINRGRGTTVQQSEE